MIVSRIIFSSVLAFELRSEIGLWEDPMKLVVPVGLHGAVDHFASGSLLSK